MRKLICLLGAVALVSVTPTAHAAFPGLNGKIAFYNHPVDSEDIFVMNPDGSGITALTGPPQHERNPVWSPDGTKIAFELNGDVHVMNADGTGAVNLTGGSFGVDASPTWSPDGSKIAFVSSRSGMLGVKIYIMNADGSDPTPIMTDTTAADGDPAWSPNGLRIAFVRGGSIYTVKPDGTDLQPVISGPNLRMLDWSPSGDRIAYQRPTAEQSTTGIHTIQPDGSNDVDLSSFLPSASDPAWSPDGTKIVANKNGQLWTINPNGSGAIQLTTTLGTYGSPSWQPLPYPGYPRPKSATPLRVPLVPAFAPCTSPDRTHGPPLSFGSCSTPSERSPNLTVGTPDANGAAANSVGWFKIQAHVGTPGPPDDSGASIEVELADVRCKVGTSTCGPANAAAGADYTGELQLDLQLQMTDKFNAVAPGGGSDSATGSVAFPVPVTCTATASTSIGAQCSVTTDANYVAPGSIKDTKRAIWAMDQVRLTDGGPDGDVDTPDNSVFAVQGLFVP